MKLATTPDINLLYTSDNLFMQIVEPEEISYVYKIRPARNFGVDFVSIVERLEPIAILACAKYQFFTGALLHYFIKT